MWASIKPGTTVAPRNSTTRPPGANNACISLSLPTARKRSPAIATAEARGRRASIV